MNLTDKPPRRKVIHIERCNRHRREFRTIDGCELCRKQKRVVDRAVNAVRFAVIAGEAEENVEERAAQ